MMNIYAFIFATQFFGFFTQNITICNSLAGFSVNSVGVTVCNQDGSGLLRDASEVCTVVLRSDTVKYGS
jgi:hypothetical protein